MRFAAALALALAILSPAAAQEVEITIDNVLSDKQAGSIIEAVVKVRNLTDRMIRSVYVECAFMNALDRAVDTGLDIVTDLAPGQVKYAKPSARWHGSMIQQQCYVDAVRY